MKFNTDGFNERINYINNANDLNMVKKRGAMNIDDSIVKMKIEENKPDIKTASLDKKIYIEEVRGLKENFVLRNYNMSMSNSRKKTNNSVSKALNNNILKKF